MAETVVTFAIAKLVQFAKTEADLVGSLPGEIRSISNELQSIKAILKDAEEKSENDDSIKEWVRQVREVAYQIEDIIDDYLVLKHEQKRIQQVPHHPEGGMNSCFDTRNLLSRLVQCFTQLRPKHELSTDIKMIKDEIVAINMRRERYQFITTDQSSHRGDQENDISWHDICTMYVDETELVGLQGPRTEIIRVLRDNRMVAVVGMGGLGKSTLARQVYIQEWDHFYIHAWVTVSQSYNMVDLMKSIYKQFHENRSEYDPVPLDDTSWDLKVVTEELRRYLTATKYSYIVVLDDVWDEESLIHCVRAALPANNNSSRIMMTTRDEDTATTWTASLNGYIYQLRPLPTDVAWHLFCKKIFGSWECPEELSGIAYDIVKKCDGLPLAIVAVGGLLSTKRKDPSEWRKLRDTLGSEFAKNRRLKSSTRILLLSYLELPCYLKPCFLYFGMFPEDCSIDCMRLVRLWIVEGFIENCRGKTLEEVALEYLIALVRRNLVQVSHIDETGRCRSFRVHDILREIIISKLEESGFSQVMTKDSILVNTHFRRLSIHSSFDKSMQICSTACKIRSVLVFDNEQMSSLLTSSQPKLFRFLRVLDLQDASISVIPEEVGDLHNLHLLSLRNTEVVTLPRSIGRLFNLQTLDLKGSKVSEIPSEVKHLQKLRHLLGYNHSFKQRDQFEIVGTEIPVGVLENLWELQKLAFIGGSQRSRITELINLKQLIRLGITGLRTKNGADLCRAIAEMVHLRSLAILSAGRYEVLDLQNLIQPPPFLERLYLTGPLEKLPGWISKLNNLVKLALRCSVLDHDPVVSLQGLANLVELEITEAYTGWNLDFGQNRFIKLRLLRLSGLHKLERIQGALPALQHFRFPDCQCLTEVPPHMRLYLPWLKCAIVC